MYVLSERGIAVKRSRPILKKEEINVISAIFMIKEVPKSSIYKLLFGENIYNNRIIWFKCGKL